MEHTKTPWEITQYFIKESNGHRLICNKNHITSSEDVKFIVKAVNNHERLVDALRYARFWVDNPLVKKGIDNVLAEIEKGIE